MVFRLRTKPTGPSAFKPGMPFTPISRKNEIRLPSHGGPFFSGPGHLSSSPEPRHPSSSSPTTPSTSNSFLSQDSSPASSGPLGLTLATGQAQRAVLQPQNRQFAATLCFLLSAAFLSRVHLNKARKSDLRGGPSRAGVGTTENCGLV